MSSGFSPPSCSRSSQKDEVNKQQTLVNENLELYINNDKAEIERLESEERKKTSHKKDDKNDVCQEDEREAKIKFHCFSCDMDEMVHYFGLEPKFAFGIKFNERTYVMRDPFQPPPPRWKTKAEYFVALGAHCKECDQVVCKDNECSFFYINTYCLKCAKKIVHNFPSDIQQKLKKQLSSF